MGGRRDAPGADEGAKGGKVELHVGKVPPDIEGQLQFCLDQYRKLTGKEPTPDEIEKAKAALEPDSGEADRSRSSPPE